MVKDPLGEQAKKSLIEFVELIDDRLVTTWNNELSDNFGYNEDQKELVRKILEHAKEHNLRSGKRLRASFVYYSYLLGNREIDEKIWMAAESVELVHTALLMHDDFMDEDKLRRGKPTTHEFFANNDKHYGECMAVNIGDAVLCMGYEKLLRSGFECEQINRAMTQLLRGITNTAYGQAYDVSLPKLGDISSEKVVALHRAKTAIYTYENPLFIGGILGGLSEEVMMILKEYSEDGGVAFQLQDDILGVFGDEEKTGKSSDSDLLQGKVTLLITKAFELATEQQKRDLLKVWGNKEASSSEIELAKKAIKDCGSYEFSVKTAKEMAKKAAGTASDLRKFNLNNDAVDYIEGIARYMVEREV